MNRLVSRGLCCAFIVCMSSGAIPTAVAGPVLLASAEMGAAGHDSGTSITTAQFVGWRFSIDQPLAVQRVGGHLWADPFQPGEIFAALVRLDSLMSLPHGAPFTEEEVVATALFRPNFPSDEYLTPLSATLTPGSYALVFGSGEFGSTGFGALPNDVDQPDIPPTDISSFIFWSRPRPGEPMEWRENLASHMRVVIEAQTLPLAGDYDLNGVVEQADYDVWAAAFGATGDQAADGNDDGLVDAADFTIWRDNFAVGSGTGAAAVVPEPAAAIIGFVAIALSALVRIRTRREFPRR